MYRYNKASTATRIKMMIKAYLFGEDHRLGKDEAKGAMTSAGVMGKEASESRVPWRHVHFNQYANMTDTNYTEAPRPL